MAKRKIAEEDYKYRKNKKPTGEEVRKIVKFYYLMNNGAINDSREKVERS